jgi:hypothetical protein
MDKRELSPNAVNFIKEYRELCKKYNIMVLSDGEQVSLGRYEEDLWLLEKETFDLINHEFRGQAIYDAISNDNLKPTETTKTDEQLDILYFIDKVLDCCDKNDVMGAKLALRRLKLMEDADITYRLSKIMKD